MHLHRSNSRSRQRGLSFISIIIVGLLAVAIFAIGGQSIPIFVEAQSIQKALDKAKVGGSVAEVRATFDKAGQIDDIRSIKGADLDVTKNGDKVVVRAKYDREIPLAGPAYLVYRFDLQSK